MLPSYIQNNTRGRDLAFLVKCFNKHWEKRNYSTCVYIGEVVNKAVNCPYWQGALAAAKWAAKA
jgi:hypothetical protein